MSEAPSPVAKPAALTPDLCVIGAGTGGLAVATAAAAFGVPVVLIERDRMGGEIGSTAVAALTAASARAQAVREAGGFGLDVAAPIINDARLHDHIQRVIATTAPNVSAERMTALGVTVIRGEARFVSRSTVVVGEQTIKARRFVIATGATEVAPPIPGLDLIACLTPASLATATRRPERLIVLGGDGTGVAIAQAMARLGSDVTLVEPGGLLASEDPEAVTILRRALLREGVALHEQAPVLSARSRKGGVSLVLADGEGGIERTIEGTHLLLATARAPAITSLDLELAGIASGVDGIRVDRGLRSTNRRVYAIGRCAAGMTGGAMVAEEHARLVLRHALFRQSGRFDPHLAPRVTQTEPALASVGLSEAEARAAHGAIQVLRWPYAESGFARSMRMTAGFVKLITDAKGKVLGVCIAGAQAGELIATWSLALKSGKSAQEMAQLILPDSTLAEIAKRAATSHFVPLATKPGLRRLIGFLRRFG